VLVIIELLASQVPRLQYLYFLLLVVASRSLYRASPLDCLGFACYFPTGKYIISNKKSIYKRFDKSFLIFFIFLFLYTLYISFFIFLCSAFCVRAYKILLKENIS
jgi:hypothetical protein